VRQLRAESGHARRPHAAAAGARHDCARPCPAALRGDARGRRARRPRVEQPDRPDAANRRRRQGALRHLLRRLPRRGRGGRRSARAEDPEPAGVLLGARAGDAGRADLPRHHVRVRPHAVPRVAAPGDRPVARRGARADAAAPRRSAMTRHDRFVLGPLARNIAWSLVVAGAAAIAAGLAVDPRRTWPNLLIDGFYTTAIAVAGVVFIALQLLTGATWNAGLRRIPEALMAALPASGVMSLALFFGRDWLYPAHRAGADDAAAGAHVIYFGAPLFFGRMALFVALWVLFARLIRRASLQQDRQRDDAGAARQHERLIRYSAMFTVVFAISFSIASFDWLMSVVP